MRIDRRNLLTALFACFAVLLATSNASAASFTVGGKLSGLITGRSVTLLNNGTDALKLTANGTFTFKTPLPTGSAYSVTVSVQPTGQTCTVTAGTGKVGTSNVTTVVVTCKPNNYTIGGTLSGLITGRTVTLLDNGTDTLKVTANGKFTFAKAVPSGSAYKVTVSVQPSGQTCTVTAGTGTVVAGNVTTVVVTCKPNNYTIGGTLSGLIAGRTLTLLDNGTDSLAVKANGKFTFAKTVASGSAYKVTVSVQPAGQTCTVTAGTGTVVAANITTVVVTCTANSFTIGGTVSGLTSGASVTLLDNATDSLKVTVNGSFTFAKAVASGSTYSVTVSVQPTGETCTVTAGTGTVVAANITTVVVTCTAKTYTIGGTVSGLTSGASVTLLDNATDSLKVAANGSFTFAKAVASGSAYNVTVSVQPTGETCVVTAGSGTVASANITTVVVTCTAKSFTIGGTVSGLSSGTSVTLLDNATDPLKVAANGTFTFAKAVASGSTYNVTVSVQPTGETCTVTGGSGTVAGANITTVAVACSTGSGGGGGAYWIPYTATPTPNVTPTGKNGLFIIPSDKLTTSPAPTFVTTDTAQILALGSLIAVSGGVATYSPQVMMYADTDSSGITRIFGLALAGTSTVPKPVQISSLALPSGQQVCTISASAQTDVSQPTTLFAVIEVGTSTQCAAQQGTFEVVHYTDSSTTAPAVVKINTTTINSIYQNGKLTGLVLYDSVAKSLDVYADNTFTTPSQKITSLNSASNLATVLDEATLSTTGLFYAVTTTASVNYLYRIDGASQAATQIQDVLTDTISLLSAQDDSNLYYEVLNSTSTSTTVNIYQVALTGGTPKLLYTAPAYATTSGSPLTSYHLIGSNDSVVDFELDIEPETLGIPDPTMATATLYAVPVGTTTTTPTTVASYPTGNQLTQAFLATPSGGALSSSVLFATARHATGTFPLFTYAYTAQSMHPGGGTTPVSVANSVYAPLAVISARLTFSAWQVTGITDTNGGYGGGIANLVNVSNLTDTPLTTTGGGDYTFSTGFTAGLVGISSNNVAIGFLNNSAAILTGGTLQEDGAAVDLTKNFFYPVVLTNTLVFGF